MRQSSGMPAETLGDASPPESGRRFGFVPALDGLRGLAVLLVVAYHFRVTIDPWTTRWKHAPGLARALGDSIPVSPGGWLLIHNPHPSFVAQLVPKGGFLGVDIFFVLSGFLITSLLLREQLASGRVKCRAFYRRRALRLLPALLFFVTVQVIYSSIIRVHASVEHSSVVAVIFYYFNWKVVYSFPAIPLGLGHLWSLSVEEQFYLVWPLATIFLLGARRRLATVLVAFGGSILAIAIWRVILTHHMGRHLVYVRTDARADSLLVGALAAHLWVRKKIPPRRFLVPAAWVSVMFLTICLYTIESTDHFLYDGGFTAIALAVAIILFATLETEWRASRVLRVRALQAIGRVSYGLYLWHYLVFSAVAQQTRTAPVVVSIVVGLVAAAVLTLLSWYFVERPFLRLKHPLNEGPIGDARAGTTTLR